MTMKTLLLSLMALSIGLLASANDIYYVQFTDKANSPYSVSAPQVYLSQRALDRRAKWNIAIDSTDFPVNPAYVAAVAQTGAVVKHTSRWMNGALIVTSNSHVVEAVNNLPCVLDVELVYEWNYGGPKKSRAEEKQTTAKDYGTAAAQHIMIGLDRLHDAGFRGEGIVVAVIDAGYYNVDMNPAFDSLRLRGGILGTYDFVNAQSNIYQEHSHGSTVLTTMAANLPGQYLGAAPNADYWLLRSEDTDTEWPVEADYWIIAAEFADSVGADIINTSLGYAVFDNSSLNYAYSDLDGKTIRSSKAALMSARKGIITLVSAGNEGNSDWGTIFSPADADSILTVGGVDQYGQIASFSSYGPSADRRVKPDICTVGEGSAVVDVFGTPTFSNGTSFSSPIAAGMMACVLQSRPDLHPQTLIQLIRESSSRYHTPDDFYGYGIPNAMYVYNGTTGTDDSENLSDWGVYPNPVEDLLQVKASGKVRIQLLDLWGRRHLTRQIRDNGSIDMSNYTDGIYLLTIDNGSQIQTFRIVKN